MTAPLPVGELVAARYRIVRHLGGGRLGEVFEVLDLQIQERVALKRVPSALLADTGLLERLKRALALARTVTHASVCRIFDVGFDGDAPFWTMELALGESLAARIRRVGPLSSRETLSLIRQLAAGLDAAHRAGLAHRALASSNVLVVGGDRAPRALITDFGIAEEALRDDADFAAARLGDLRALGAVHGEMRGCPPAALRRAPQSAGDLAAMLAADLRRRTARLAVGLALAVLAAALAGLLLAARARLPAGQVPAEGCGYRGPARIEIQTDRAAFMRAIGRARVVDFDDIDTAGAAPAAFTEDRYRERGILIRSAGGQYAGRSFATRWRPRSAPNFYAAGPPRPHSSAQPLADRATDVSFRAGGSPACTSAFGVDFIGVDYSAAGQPAIAVLDARGAALAGVAEFTSTDPTVFRGFVAKDPEGNLVSVIAQVRIGTGNQWPEDGAGGIAVLLDDLTFAPVVPARD